LSTSAPPNTVLAALCVTMISTTASGNATKPIVLHIGDPVKWNTEFYDVFSTDFTVVRPSLKERQRAEFMNGLREKRWGNFSAIFRPFWNTGGEMGRWDKELVPLIPDSCKIFASAGAGFDWADVDLLAEKGTYSSQMSTDLRLTEVSWYCRYRILQQVLTNIYSGSPSVSDIVQCSRFHRGCC